jgi:hypothetical protein
MNQVFEFSPVQALLWWIIVGEVVYEFLTSHVDEGRTADVTGQQMMLTPLWHLILPWLLSGVCVALH